MVTPASPARICVNGADMGCGETEEVHGRAEREEEKGWEGVKRVIAGDEADEGD